MIIKKNATQRFCCKVSTIVIIWVVLLSACSANKYAIDFVISLFWSSEYIDDDQMQLHNI